jgi:hypothetical protein
MIKDVIEAIRSAARKMFTNWGALLISMLFYAALVAVFFHFFSAFRMATMAQVLSSVVIPIVAAIFFFFVLQAIGLSYVRIGVGPFYLLKRALKDCWKLLLVSLPVILLAWLVIYLFDRAQATFFSESLTVESPAREWIGVAVNWLRFCILYIVLPLTAIHLWISTAREGVKTALKKFAGNMARALAPRSVLTYVLVVAVFGVIAHFLFFTKTPAKNEWMELWLLGARLAAALLAVFLGWLLALGSLSELTARREMNEVES